MLAEKALAGPCDEPTNPVVCENSKQGSPPSQWDVDGAGDPSIQGFATEISVDQGATVDFKIDTDASEYHLDIYRMGYYDGDGARKVDSIEPTAALPQIQDPCDTQPSTGLVDCGNWEESASWQVPADAVSGIYFAKLIRGDQPSEGSHVIFIVRDDDGGSDLLFQTSDTTWQAYNRYGGSSLYEGGPGTDPGRAYKVSYNRPLTTRGPTPEDSPFSAEYPMVRWLERNGYDVSYFTGVDADRSGAEMLEHKVYLSVGHDEYWSAQQRANVEAARDAGVDLAFFSGNEIFWKTRWENSIDGANTDRRTLVSYKETHANKKLDPSSVWTGTWRDPRFSPPADGGRPENALSGTIFTVNSTTAAIEVPAADGRMRLWRGTNIASLGSGQTATLADGTLGYEWDSDLDNGFRPAGLFDLSTTTVEAQQRLLDYGSTYGPGSATHHLTLYRAPSGALVFGAGTIQWSWGLDGEHDRGGSTPDSRMQQATVNLLADMGVQPATRQGDLAAATQTTDVTPPTTTISSPGDGSEIESGETVAIKGVATDAEGETGGGQVGGVEVSTDSGTTWHPAEGRDQWTYSWTPGAVGGTEILARAVDDSGNLESSADQVEVDVVEPTCPCSIWSQSFTASQDSDSNAVELGVKFRSDIAGLITGIRFYKTADNTGPHVGHLWTSSGSELAEATFTGETPSGWQTVTFDQPVAIDPGVTYVASYHAPDGHYADLPDYFSLVGADNGPLHALADGVAGGNGVFRYGPSGSLFSGEGPESFNATNYLVDVVFDDQAGSDATPPLINSRAPADAATEISPNVTVAATFNEAINPGTVSVSTFRLRDPSGALIPATVSYSAAERRMTLDPNSPLLYSTTYTVTARGGPGGIDDIAGNHLAADSTWSFTTSTAPPPPPDDGPGGPILVISNTANPFSRYYAEILRAEGMNEFLVKDISTISAPVLSAYDVVILGEGPLNASQAELLSTWVNQGGNLIAMRPDHQLAGLLGLSSIGGTLANAYLKVDTGTAAGAGVVGETIQFHGPADRYTAAGSQTIASLYSGPSTATSNPAVTLRSVGSNGGQAAAFSYDLAKSIVYTRQGNPAWSGQERDGAPPIRSDDLFFGAKAGDVQPDWVDLDKVAIPQADEQQRLLTNLIGRMNRDRKPLPRFWFLPHDEKAAVVMTGDDHGHAGTVGRFEQYEAESPSGCVAAEWQCIRATSYVYPSTPMSDSQAAAFTNAGFEIALHPATNCADWVNRTELEAYYSSQLEAFASTFPSLPAPSTNRTHCVAWGDWATQPKVELQNGMRLDTNYYYWPPAWVKDKPGMFTGSGMPMRFADLDGSMIDVYQAATQMTDESGQTFPFTADTLLDNALGAKGYYGVFTANMHTDDPESEDGNAVVASALARDVPIVSAKQMLTWLDGRNQSSFGSIGWADNKLTFTVSPGAGANGLRAMVPVTSATWNLVSVERGGTPVATTTRTIKGTKYAFFDGTAGSYTANYGFQLGTIVPSSPANQNSPKIQGEAPVGSTVRIYTSSDCSGPPLVTASAAELAAGVAVSVADNTTTQFRAIATPEGGSPSLCSAAISYSEDSSAPAVAIDSLSKALLGAAGTSELQWHANENGSFELRVGGVGCATGTMLDSGAYGTQPGLHTSSVSASSLSEGTNTLRLCVADAASNRGSATTTIVKDTTAPQTQIDLGPAAISPSAAAKFEFSGTDSGGSGIASFECRRDSSEAAAWLACSSGQIYAAFADGAHKFEVRAIDQAGNVDASPATFDWTVDTALPQTQIDSGPSPLAASSGAQFTFSATDAGGTGVASFECRRDGGAWGTCTTPTSYGSLADGAHKFEVRAIDQAGNVDESPATFTWSIDTTAPDTQIVAKPQLLSASAAAKFGFSGSDGTGSGVTSFQCRRDSSLPAEWQTCTSPKEYTALADGAHKFEVRAIDAAGNVDASAAIFNWTIDTTAPNTQIDANPQALSASAAAKFEFSASDGSGVASIECRRDSLEASAWQPCTSPKEYTALADGAHKFEVRAIDAAGNVDASPAIFNWTIDTTAPDTQINSSPPAVSASASAKFTFSGSDAGGSGVASFQCRRDSKEEESWQPCASPRNDTSLTDGAHKFEVRAIDLAGNVDASPAVFSWTIDTVAPQTQVDATPQPLSASPVAKLEFSGSDGTGSGVTSFQCRRDSLEASAWQPCTSPKEYTALADGAHKFEARAIDAAGNVDASPAIFNWSVDTIAPTTQIDLNPASVSGSAAAKFEFSGADLSGSGVASFQCRRDSEVWAACSSPRSYASLSDGNHSFEVRSIDQAGNVDSTPAAFSWTVDTTGPQTQINSSPSTLEASPDAEFSFAGTDAGGSGVASLQCRRDAEDWASCGSPKSYADLADGAHKFEVRAIDTAGNVDSSPAVFNWSIDTTAPQTAIDSSPAALVSSPTAEFVFSGNDGAGSGVSSFQCRRDAEGWEACDSPESYASLSDGDHDFEARAIDQAGNADDSPAEFEWSIDTTIPPAPQLTTTAPVSPANENSPTIVGTASEGSTVRLYAGADCSGSPIAIATAAELAAGISVSVADDSTTEFRATATSAAEVTSSCSAPLAYVEDSTAPQTTIDGQPADPSPQDTAIFVFSASDSGSGVASFECSRDGETWEPCASPRSYGSLSDGTHSFEVRAIDQAGNVDASPAVYGWSIDTTAPDTQIDSGPAVLTTTPSAIFEFSGSDAAGSGVASFQCSMDGEAWAACDSPKSYESLPDGDHSFWVRAVDQAGNVDGSPADFNWTIDTTAPQTQINTHPPAVATSASAEFTFKGTDTGSGIAFECRRDGEDWAACDSPKSYSSLGDGSHSFDVRAIDQAGNIDASPATFSWIVDTAPPSAPQLTATVPGSPANDNSPKIVGTAPAGSTVRLYTGAECLGSPLASVPAAQLAAGVTISVPDNSTTIFSAKAISAAGNPSPCSTTLTYVEDSSAPDTQIDSQPAALATLSTAEFTFSAFDAGGHGIGSFECRRDAAGWAPCSSPKSYGSLADGAHSFEVRAIDLAGNVDGSPATYSWTVDTANPPGTGAPPPGSIRIERIKYNKTKGTALLFVRVPGPGILSASTPVVSPQDQPRAATRSARRADKAHRVKATSIEVTEAGLVKLPIKLTPAGRALLLEGRKVRVDIEVEFESAEGWVTSKRITARLTRRPR